MAAALHPSSQPQHGSPEPPPGGVAQAASGGGAPRGRGAAEGVPRDAAAHDRGSGRRDADHGVDPRAPKAHPRAPNPLAVGGFHRWYIGDMAIDSISPVMSASPLTSLSRPPETTPSARETAAQENDARRNAEAVSGASPAAFPAQAPDQRPRPRADRHAGPGGGHRRTRRDPSARPRRRSRAPRRALDTSTALRTASEAYQSEAAARDTIAQQQQETAPPASTSWPDGRTALQRTPSLPHGTSPSASGPSSRAVQRARADGGRH